MPPRPKIDLSTLESTHRALVDNVCLAVHGKRDAIDLVVTAMLAGGHVLIEDVPGVGKTVLARALAASIDGTWARVQFTPDLLPSDLLGVTAYADDGSPDFRPGPVFHNLVLGDEINRASPRTQSALLEAMEERQVSVDSETHPLPDPFLVVATQNPTDLAGTYPLPENQLDRFMARVTLGYPDPDTEMHILDTHLDGGVVESLGAVTSADTVASLVAAASEVFVADALKRYTVDIAAESRRHPALAVGISPRAALALVRAARVRAASQGRAHVVPDDLTWLLHPVLGHRLLLRPDAELAGTDVAAVLDEIISRVPVPTRRSPAARAGAR